MKTYQIKIIFCIIFSYVFFTSAHFCPAFAQENVIEHKAESSPQNEEQVSEEEKKELPAEEYVEFSSYKDRMESTKYYGVSDYYPIEYKAEQQPTIEEVKPMFKLQITNDYKLKDSSDMLLNTNKIMGVKTILRESNSQDIQKKEFSDRIKLMHMLNYLAIMKQTGIARYPLTNTDSKNILEFKLNSNSDQSGGTINLGNLSVNPFQSDNFETSWNPNADNPSKYGTFDSLENLLLALIKNDRLGRTRNQLFQSASFSLGMSNESSSLNDALQYAYIDFYRNNTAYKFGVEIGQDPDPTTGKKNVKFGITIKKKLW